MRSALPSTLAMISILFILVASATPSLAADYSKVGVSAGDWTDYSVSYYSTIFSDPASEYVSWNYNRVHVDIREVARSNVSVTVTYFYPDKKPLSETYWVNVSKSPGGYLIAAGLSAGDPIYVGNGYWSGVENAINETISMTVLGVQRWVNRVESLRLLDAQSILYFDQVTGILVESRRSSLLFGWMVERITSTSLWSSENSVWLWLGAGFAAGMAAIIIIIPVSAARKKP